MQKDPIDLNFIVKGAIPDSADKRDYIKEIQNFKEESVNLLDDVPNFQIQNQFSTGACTGFAMSSFLNILYRKINKQALHINPFFTYYLSRELIGLQGQDEGSTLRETMKATRNTGAVTREMWPITNPSTQPTKEDRELARFLKIKNYFRIPPNKIFEGIVHTLVTEHLPVVASLYTEDSAWNLAGHTGILLKQDSKLYQGGHAICIYGYDKDTQQFLAINSWGTSWGNKGFFRITKDCLINDIIDAWTVEYNYF